MPHAASDPPTPPAHAELVGHLHEVDAVGEAGREELEEVVAQQPERLVLAADTLLLLSALVNVHEGPHLARLVMSRLPATRIIIGVV